MPGHTSGVTPKSERQGYPYNLGPTVIATVSLGNKLTQKDNADSGVQFITPAGPSKSLLLAKDPDQHL